VTVDPPPGARLVGTVTKLVIVGDWFAFFEVHAPAATVTATNNTTINNVVHRASFII
jgi:hypothetical protein